VPPKTASPQAPFKITRLSLFLLVGAGGFWGFFKLISLLLRYAPEPIGSRSEVFVGAARETLLLTTCSGALGLALGVLGGLGKLSRPWILRAPTEFLIWIIRGTPLLIQILFVFYAVPMLIPWLKLDEFSASMLALAFNVGAYNAEVVRAGILAIPKGQREAAQSLGLSQFQILRWIVLPQAFRVVIPPLINNIVALLKDSSLASAIGVLELGLAGNRIASETFLPVPVLTTTACLYLALTTVLTIITSVLEKKLKLAQ
jgi:polar amino acid transport system permease protein